MRGQSELAALHHVFDVDGDGKVTLKDLEDAITRQAYDVTERVLSPVNPRAIIDIQVTYLRILRPGANRRKRYHSRSVFARGAD